MTYTEEQRRAIINEWKISGLSKKAFCRERNIVSQTFHNWFKRMGKTPSGGFTEVALSGIDQPGGCEIIFPSGARMLLHGQPSPSWLREVLRS